MQNDKPAVKATSATESSATETDELGPKDYVLTLADGSTTRWYSNNTTNHNGIPVVASYYAPKDA